MMSLAAYAGRCSHDTIIVSEYRLLFVIGRHIRVNVHRILCTCLTNYMIGTSLVLIIV